MIADRTTLLVRVVPWFVEHHTFDSTHVHQYPLDILKYLILQPRIFRRVRFLTASYCSRRGSESEDHRLMLPLSGIASLPRTTQDRTSPSRLTEHVPIPQAGKVIPRLQHLIYTRRGSQAARIWYLLYFYGQLYMPRRLCHASRSRRCPNGRLQLRGYARGLTEADTKCLGSDYHCR